MWSNPSSAILKDHASYQNNFGKKQLAKNQDSNHDMHEWEVDWKANMSEMD